MKHAFKFNEDAQCSICEECGYVWGETPYRKCGEIEPEIEPGVKCLHLFHGRNSETKETYCKDCGHVLTEEEIRLDNERRR